MSYNQKSLFAEVLQAVENLSRQAVNMAVERDKALAKLASLKADRVAMYDADQLLPVEDQKYAPGMVTPNAKMAASYGPGETISELYVDEAEAAILEVGVMVEAGGSMDAIRKLA